MRSDIDPRLNLSSHIGKFHLFPIWEHVTVLGYAMRIIAIKTLKDFWAIYPESAEALKAWYAITRDADWKNANDVKTTYRNASILQEGRVVFNIAGNKFRLIVSINYPYRVVYIRFIGTHKQYDKIDAHKV